MKETDTENPIEWPAWCYTANKPPTDIVDVAPAQANTAAALGFQKSAVPYQPPSVDQRHTTVKRRPPADTTPPKRPKLLPAAGRSSTQASDIELAAAKRLADALNAIAAANNIIGQTASPPPPLPPHQQHRQHRAASKTPTPSPPEAPAELNAGEKMLSDRSLLLSRFNAIEHSVKKYSGDSGGTKALAGDAARGGAHANASSTAAAAAAAAAYLYFEKAKNEKFGSAAREYSSSQLTNSLEEALADAGKQHYGSSSAASHKSSGSSGSNFTGSHSNSAGSLAEAHTGSNHLHLHQQHRDHFNNNTVKRERLSPATTNGGDVPARSRSATPSSFRGTPPHQSLRNSPPQSVMPIHNLSTNLLNSIQQAAASQKSSAASSGSTSQAASGGSAGNQLPTDFTMPTCSDFMRSMAAKYNNMNPNDSQTTRRSSFFDSASPSTSLSRGLSGTSKHAAGSASTSVSMLGRKEPSPTVGALSSALPPPPPASISPADVAAAALKTQNVQIAAAAAAAANAAAGSNSVSPFMASLLSSLPFSQGVFPPLIDMSSTQALVTLARAAKEAEIQQVLRAVQQPKQHSNSSRASLSPRPTLTAAIQQAAQFITPALLQLQQHQQQQQAQSLSPTSRHSSPVHNLTSAKHPASASLSGGRDKTSSNLVASPLDLSSQPPPAKRFKAESTSSQSSGTADFIGSDTRRMSFTTVTPSPPLSTTPVMDASTPAKDNQRVSSSKARQCQAQSEEVQSWTVDDVCTFVGEIDICSEYIQHFRDQQIDGSGLPLLTEDHLVNSLGMKLGPALKLRSVLAKKLGGPCPCVACVAQAQQILALQAAGGAAPAAPAASSSAAAHSLAVETTTTTTSTTTSPVALRVSSGGPSAAAAGGDSGSDCTTTHQSIGNGAFSLYETNSCGTASGSSSSSNPATTVPAKSGNSLPTICHNNEAKSNDGNNNDSSSSNCNASGDDAVEAAVLSIKQRKRSGSGDSVDSGGGGGS